MIAFGATNVKEEIIFGMASLTEVERVKERRDNDRFEVVFQFASNERMAVEVVNKFWIMN